MSNKKHHRWSGFPGAWCLICGIEETYSLAICCVNCRIVLPHEEKKHPYEYICEEHRMPDCIQEPNVCCLECGHETRMVFYGHISCENCHTRFVERKK